MHRPRRLALLLAGTRDHRARHAEEISELAKRLAVDETVRVLDAEGLLVVGGRRLLERLDLGPPLRRAVARRAEVQRRRGLALEAASLSAVGRLAANGIPAAVLKGPLLSRVLYGDPGARRSADVDLLVLRECFPTAIETLVSAGWSAPVEPQWSHGLPLFEATLDGPAPIDLHWRVHWYEEALSRRLVETGHAGGDGDPLSLACLLLFWARDGFWGLRHGADVAAWWDRFGPSAPAGGLDLVARRHPELERSLCVAATVAERRLGFPAAEQLSRSSLRRHAGSLATGMLGHREPARGLAVSRLGRAHHPVVVTHAAIADCLLAPPGGRATALRRQLLPPAATVPGAGRSTGLGRVLARARYAALVGGELSVRAVPVLWRARRRALA